MGEPKDEHMALRLHPVQDHQDLTEIDPLDLETRPDKEPRHRVEICNGDTDGAKTSYS